MTERINHPMLEFPKPRLNKEIKQKKPRLKKEQILEIRESKVSNLTLGYKYNVTRQQIGRIKCKYSWSYLE